MQPGRTSVSQPAARAWLTYLLTAALLGGGAGGCARKDRSRKPHTRKGVIKAIDLEKQYARVEVHDRSGRKQIEMDGSFNDQTVVTIDGRPARFEDVRPGDAVEITVTISGKGLDAEFTATRVNVLRNAATAPSG
jgi:hypothetical protein